MAYIKIKSNNEMFSHVLQKNPATQEANGKPFEKTLKDARTLLWFENPQEAFLLLQPFENKRGKGFEYLDYSQISGGQAYLQLITSQLRTAATVEQPFDNVEATLEFNIYNHHEKDYTLSFPGKISSITSNCHSLITITGASVKECLEICSIISISAFLHDKEVYVEEPQFIKHFASLVKLTNHYPILRNFVSFIKSQRAFNLVQDHLHQTPFNFQLRRAYDSRKDYYTKCVESTGVNRAPAILDLGCGEGGYFKLHPKYYEQIDAVELDTEVYTDATHTARKIQLEDKIKIHNQSIQDYLDSVETLENTDVLLTEVLEHMPYDDAVSLMYLLISKRPKSIILTLPNHSFNKFYDLTEGEFRHDDHDWEPTHMQLLEFLYTSCNITDYNDTIEFLGDQLKTDTTVCTTFGIHLTRKD